jgi:ABC-type transport system involved in multi-copper enzyme maturation permease subunit
VTAIGFLEMYIAMFPTIKEQSGQFDQMLKAMPQEIFKAMNMDVSSLSFGNLESYLSTEYMSFLWPILGIIFVISLANYILVNEVEKGTIETLASLPATRSKVFIERYSAGIVLLVIFVAVSIFAAIPLAQITNSSVAAINYLTTALGGFLFMWAIYSVATMFSTIFSEKGKATMATGGVLILMYVLNIIAALNDNLTNIKYASFFNYFNGSDLLAKNIFSINSLFVLGGVAIATTLIALFWVNRRDLSV